MIFAKVDVLLPRHPRFLQIPRGSRRASALGAFAAALCYAREHETDGELPRSALDGYATSQTIADLLSSELLIASGETLIIRNYAGKNETRADIAARRAGTAQRVAKFREKSVSNALPPDSTNAFVPGSGSGSGSDQTQTRAREVVGIFDMGPPTWAAGVSEATGKPCVPPSAPSDFRALNAVVQAGAPENVGAEEVLVWLRADAKLWAQTVDLAYGGASVASYVRWVNGGRQPKPSGKFTKAPGAIEHEQVKKRQAEAPDPVLTRVIAKAQGAAK